MIHALTPGEASPHSLTDARYDVRGPPVVTESGAVFYESNAPLLSEARVFRLTPDGADRITSRPGAHHGYPSPDGGRAAALHSDDVTRTELYLYDLESAGALVPNARTTRSTCTASCSGTSTGTWGRSRGPGSDPVRGSVGGALTGRTGARVVEPWVACGSAQAPPASSDSRPLSPLPVPADLRTLRDGALPAVRESL